MTTHFDVSADLLIPALADAMEGIDAISTPDWADYVKTGVTRRADSRLGIGGSSAQRHFLGRLPEMVRLASGIVSDVRWKKG